ncbi:hypothetical protein HDV00_008867 [Rhizophlyctis rosea]|nr:hypothetical protein HDV00_008867 [Rhizophlyctis rosea]
MTRQERSALLLLLLTFNLLWQTNRGRKAGADITDLESPQNFAHPTGTRNGKQSFTQKRISQLGDFGSLASRSLIEIGSKEDSEFARARSISVGAPMGSRASSKASESSRTGLSLSDCPVRLTSLSPVASGSAGSMPQLSGTETAVDTPYSKKNVQTRDGRIRSSRKMCVLYAAEAVNLSSTSLDAFAEQCRVSTELFCRGSLE